ncbi:MAG: chemotaxis protein CheW [Opitutaceae bacterium]
MSTTEIETTTVYYLGRRGDQLFGFDARFVNESSQFPNPTKITGTRPELVGVVNLRNSVLPILLPDQWLLTPAAAYDPQKPVAVLEYDKTRVALQLDEVIGVYTTSLDQHHPHPYKAETGYFTHLVTLGNDTIFTAIDVRALLHEINSVVI